MRMAGVLTFSDFKSIMEAGKKFAHQGEKE